MAPFPHSTLTILRRRQVQAETGYSRSTIYLRITQGLWPKPVSLQKEHHMVRAPWVGLLAKSRRSTRRGSPANPTMKSAPWW